MASPSFEVNLASPPPLLLWRLLMRGSALRPNKFARTGVVLVFVLLLCLLATTAYQKYMYPYGRRGGGISLPGIYGALVAYAGDHYGWFPRSDKGSYDALQQLYDPYCPSGKELAGVSGRIDMVVDALRAGKPLDGSLTSWVYVPGFRLGDPENIAILWESKSGLYWDGRRNNHGGHAVLLVGGQITNVPAADWDNFLKQQEQLCIAVQANRAPQTNVPSYPTR
jgi:hypothetical protein